MTRSRLRAVTVGVGVTTALLLGGCSSAAEGIAEGAVERALEQELGESADVEVGEDSFTVDTEDGSLTAGAGSVPEDFPTDVPLVEGEVTFAQRLETADGLGWTLLVTTSGDPAAVAEQIRGDLQSNGFTVDEASELAGDAAGGAVLGEKADLTAFVLVSADSGETTATYTVNQQAAAS